MVQPPERYPVKEITEAVDILQEVHDRLARNPVKREEFFTLFTNFGNGAITDVKHVRARAKQLLEGHPDLAARFYGLVDHEHQAKRFLERVENAVGEENYDRFLALLDDIDAEQSLDAHEVHGRITAFFGKKYDDLVWWFIEFLPTKYDPPPPRAEAEREEHRRTSKRKLTSYDRADAPGSSTPSKAKKPRVDDGGPTPKPFHRDAGAAGGSRPSRAKKRPVDGGPTPASAAGSSRPNVSDRAAEAPDDNNDKEVKRSREAWVSATGYSKLVATIKRAEELQRERAHGTSGSGDRRRVPLEELFPRREIREYLEELYHDEWEKMRNSLENRDCIGFALEIILDRMRLQEAAAVEEATSRQDPIRAAERLDELVQDRVREDRKAAKEHRRWSSGDRREPRA